MFGEKDNENVREIRELTSEMNKEMQDVAQSLSTLVEELTRIEDPFGVVVKVDDGTIEWQASWLGNEGIVRIKYLYDESGEVRILTFWTNAKELAHAYTYDDVMFVADATAKVLSHIKAFLAELRKDGRQVFDRCRKEVSGE